MKMSNTSWLRLFSIIENLFANIIHADRFAILLTISLYKFPKLHIEWHQYKITFALGKMASLNYSYCIIAGSTKCATTSVFAWLADHPMVCGSIVKESRFFWDNTYPMPSTGYHYSNGMDSLQSIFKCEQNETTRLEATPDYMYGNTTASIINESLAGAKIIFVLRPPVDRLVSWYKFASQRNLFDAKTTFEQYVKMQVLQPDSNTPQHLRAMEQGRYAFYIKKYEQIFTPQQLLIGDYQKVSQHPQQFMEQVSKWLNIDAGFYRNYDFKILNKSVNAKNAEQYDKYRTFRRSIRKLVKALPGIISNPIKRVAKPMDSAVMQLATSDWGDVKIDSALLQQLNDYYKNDQEELKNLNSKITRV